MKIPANKTAIVLIEPQNDFLSPGGTMYAFIKEQLAERNVINNLVELLDGARGKVAKIFYCPFHEFKPGLECGMKADWGTGAWLAGTPGPKIIPQLAPHESDIVIEGKFTLDAFQSTAIDYLLRANEIEYVAFVGFHTNWCVESSARSAYDRGYRVMVIGDCTATDTEREQRYAEEVIFPKIGKVLDHKEFLASLV